MDKVEVVVIGGRGGDGVSSFRHEKFVPLGGPDGGDGGRGGSVYIVADKNVTGLGQFKSRRHFEAEPGKRGGRQKKHGAKGSDLVVKVPPGTMIFIKDNKDEIPLADLRHDGQKTLVAEGGRGGLGNVHFATSRNQAPKKATKGEPGEERGLILDLRLIADVGIIGYPNAGKSTLLAALSRATPKIAEYPFTTIEPALGVVESGQREFVLAEIPGLIEGANLGRGLGHEFLRHAERTKILLHLIDGTAADPIDNMNKLNRELELYKAEIAKKPQIVAVNKVDLPEVCRKIKEIDGIFKSLSTKAFFISAAKGEGLSELLSEITNMLDAVKDLPIGAEVPVKVFRPQPKIRRRNERQK
ncbi:MAG TPA: GTPase ObgE [Dehalococcoidia bacterium]